MTCEVGQHEAPWTSQCDNCQRRFCVSCRKGLNTCRDCGTVSRSSMMSFAKGGIGNNAAPPVVRRKMHHTKATNGGLRRARQGNRPK